MATPAAEIKQLKWYENSVKDMTDTICSSIQHYSTWLSNEDDAKLMLLEIRSVYLKHIKKKVEHKMAHNDSLLETFKEEFNKKRKHD